MYNVLHNTEWKGDKKKKKKIHKQIFPGGGSVPGLQMNVTTEDFFCVLSRQRSPSV